VAADWHAQPDLSALLRHIAETAAELLLADRASIFLWDRASQTLVAHPALGVDGEPLRIPQESGLAGQVLSSRQPRRWDRLQGADEVDRSVDLQLGYQTESLLAVPMLDSRGSPLGVFEVLNHRDGYFTQLDQALLIQLAQHAAAAVANTQQRQRLLAWQTLAAVDRHIELIGSSPAMVSLRNSVERVAATELTVLLLGENGTGKDVVSRCLHQLSCRRDGPMVAVNCAALPETLLESELFGHEKGAFTDAGQRRSGKFEAADGGTLLLDEIGDMSLAGQAKLLRVLEERVVTPLGGNRCIPVDVRLVAATNQNLLELVKQKRFREDLYFRLSVVTLELPPLRDRQRDVLELARHFLESYSAQRGQPPPQLQPSAERALLEHAWPGNVRELRNVIERLVFLRDCRQVEASDLDFVRSPWGGVGGGAPADPQADPLGLSEATTQFQQQYVMQQLAACGGSVTQAARRLKLQRANLYRKLKQLGISAAELRE
jgi:transcriptional regulator with GAF, ATPase, and Fis domain